MVLLSRFALACGVATTLTTISGAPRMQADPSCTAACEARQTKALTEAAGRRDAGGYYYGMMSSNCPQPWDQPRDAQNACWVSNESCKAKCAGLWDERYRACLAQCSDALQPCCYAVEVKNQDHALTQCVAGCPLLPAPSPSTGRKLVIDAAAEDALRSVLNQPPPGMTQKEYDDRRRERVFAAIDGQIAKMHAAYAVVSGGSDRLWVIGPGPESKRTLIEGALARFVRGTDNSAMDTWDAKVKELGRLGLSPEVLNQISGAIGLAPGSEFKAGDALFFPPGGKWPAEIAKLYGASAEHSSIRGTINGGGDFI